MVNTQKLQGSWNTLRGKIKEKWSTLSDDDLQFTSGNIDQLVGKIQHKTGEAREAIERFLNELTDSGQSAASAGAAAVSNAMGAVSQYAQHAGSRMRDHFDTVSSQAGESYDQMQRYVKHNPTRSLATVFGVGVGLGLLVGLSLRSNNRY
ncbi:MAG: hypothetical protein ABS79_07855 [Planctomycetes bacterium SCN 63-9]|nr:MAG: hypothetical protein ABS79_07855 [Planctomycetes bacterium SCN 63-9]